MGKSIEVMLASPPERDEIVAQLFHTDGGQWGEIYREDSVFKLEIIKSPMESLHLDCEECLDAMQTAIAELKLRLEGV